MNSNYLSNYYITELNNSINDYYINRFNLKFNIIDIENLKKYLLSTYITNTLFKIKDKNINLKLNKTIYIDYLNLLNDININLTNNDDIHIITLLINNIINKIKENLILLSIEYNIKELAFYFNGLNYNDISIENKKIENFIILVNSNKNSKGLFGDYVKQSLYKNLKCENKPLKIEYIDKSKDFFDVVMNNMFDDIYELKVNRKIIFNSIKKTYNNENLKYFINKMFSTITPDVFDDDSFLSSYLYNYVDSNLDILINI